MFPTRTVQRRAELATIFTEDDDNELEKSSRLCADTCLTLRRCCRAATLSKRPETEELEKCYPKNVAARLSREQL